MLFLHRCRWISGRCGREYGRRFLMGDGTDRRRRRTLVGPVAKVGAARGCTSTAATSGQPGAGGAPNPGVLATFVSSSSSSTGICHSGRCGGGSWQTSDGSSSLGVGATVTLATGGYISTAAACAVWVPIVSMEATIVAL
jgi:hypothetical protein